MKIHPTANRQNTHRYTSRVTLFGLFVTLSGCGQKGQLYPAPVTPATVLETVTEQAVDNDSAPIKQP